jgi:drug/metabolite transporter (DMT)-like permease
VIALAVAAGACFGAYNVAVRIGQSRAGDAATASLWLIVVAMAVALSISVASGDHYDVGELWPFALGGAIAPGTSQALVLRAVRDAGASRFALVVGTGPLISASVAFVYLGEPLTSATLAGIALIALGSMTLAGEQRRPAEFRAVGIVFALAAVLLFAVRDSVVRWGAVDFSAPAGAAATASLVGALVPLAAFALVSRAARGSRAGGGDSLPTFAAAGVCLALASCALYSAFRHAPVSVVASLNATQSLWTVLFASILIHEHEAVTAQLVVAALLIVSGGVIVGAAG